MITSSAQDQRLLTQRALRVLLISTAILLAQGALQAGSVEESAGYFSIIAAAVLPAVIWLKGRASGMPILPAVALAHIPYFAWPILNAETTFVYAQWEVARAGFTVTLFLLAATLAWRLTGEKSQSQRQSLARREVERVRILRLIFWGLIIGVTFHAAVFSGWLGWAGSFFGVVRCIAITCATVACFLSGVARAEGILRGRSWLTAALGAGTLMALTWSSLFLVGGVIYALAIAFGYVVVSRRLPWNWIVIALVVVSILHAGKAEMRAKYWGRDLNYSETLQMNELPRLGAEWLTDGVSAIAAGETQGGVLDRASLLQLMLRVQKVTPDPIDYLRGETYALLPATLVPRFIDADKPASQAGMNLLNIRYGVLTQEGTAVTAVGWGLISEAFANFGYFGVIAIGSLLGFFCAVLANWSARAETVSMPTLVSIACMMVLINLEADFVGLCVSLFQTLAAVFILHFAYRLLAIRQPAETEGLADQSVLAAPLERVPSR